MQSSNMRSFLFSILASFFSLSALASTTDIPVQTEDQESTKVSEESQLAAAMRAISVDTFGAAVASQASLYSSEMQAKIAANTRVINGPVADVARQVPGMPSNAIPLLNANQNLNPDEPTLEAIWGMEGAEVAEVNLMGVRYSVSRSSPRISDSHNWFLKEIHQNYVILEKRSGNRVLQKKVITLNINGNVHGQFQANHLSVNNNIAN